MRSAPAYDAGRLPHALMIHDSPGAGGDWLAVGLPRSHCVRTTADAPCGRCAGCTRVATDQHPDLIRVSPIEESKQLRIEQVRGLAEELALTSHQGGYKVGDSLARRHAQPLRSQRTAEDARGAAGAHAAHSGASQPSRLPATILSRCQKLARAHTDPC